MNEGPGKATLGMGILEGRVAVITGAGRGIGREHALLFAREGAKVLVNDLGGTSVGAGADASAAQEVVAEIRQAGGEAVAGHQDVADWEGARSLIAQGVQEFGQVDILINNAGILRDAFLHRMSEQEWDSVLHVHLKGHFSALRHAVDHWRTRSKAGEEVKGAVVNTISASGTVLPNAGQANYGSAKAAIAALTLVAAGELERLGVRVNAIAPAARTRLTVDVPMIGELVKAPEDPGAFDHFHPRHVSPLVAYLASDRCPFTGKVFAVQGGSISELHGWTYGETVNVEEEWTFETLEEHLGAATRA
jgi:NAD(P)-dependent dehydrogenase (short-subunit alcohol dehydrogenase family)